MEIMYRFPSAAREQLKHRTNCRYSWEHSARCVKPAKPEKTCHCHSQRRARQTLPAIIGNTGKRERKLDNELITTLFENITTLAQPHQFTPAEGTTEDRSQNQKKRHITQHVTVSRFHQRYLPLPILLACSLVTSPLLTNAVHSSYDAGTLTKPQRDVSCMAGTPIGLNRKK